MKAKKIACTNCGGHGFITATFENGQTSATCPVCRGSGLQEIPMTNDDRIRAMSDEELKKWYCKGRDCGGCDFGHPYGCTLLDWLQQPAEEEEHENNT